MTAPQEPFSYSRVAKANIPEFYEENSAFQRFASEAAQVGAHAELSQATFEAGLHQLYEAYFNFLHATNKFSFEDGKAHRHWFNHLKQARLGKKLGEPSVTPELLSGAASEYLRGSMRLEMLDRGLLDAFIAQETFAFIDRAGAGAMLTGGGCLLVPVAMVVGWQALLGTTEWERIVAVTAIIIAAWALLWLWPRRGTLSLYRAMRDTYQLLSGSVVSVPELRRAVERAREKGVVWPPELYAILDDVERRTLVLR